MTAGDSTATIDACAQGITVVRRLVILNLGLAAVQALSAGLLMSGYARALTVHATVAIALQLGALFQVVGAVALWRRRRVATSTLGVSIALLVIVFLQIGAGYRKSYWLHVPIGVAIFAALTRQAGRLERAAASD
jgi:hypothetical protein